MNPSPDASNGPGVLVTKITLMTSAGDGAWFRWDVVTGTGMNPDQALERLRDAARARAEAIGRGIARDEASRAKPAPRRVGPDTWQVLVVDVRFAVGSIGATEPEYVAYGTLASRDSGPLPDFGDSTPYR